MAGVFKGFVFTPTPETKKYWEAAKQRILLVQRCDDCGTHYFYPRRFCPECLSDRVIWLESSGRGRLHTFVINHRPPRGFPAAGPFVIGIVELDEGPRLMTNIVDIEPDPAKIRCDMPVEVVFEEITDEITLPKFRPLERK